jgi:hypothetical protein
MAGYILLFRDREITIAKTVLKLTPFLIISMEEVTLFSNVDMLKKKHKK